MQLQEAIKIALSSLWANKMRSVLTLIGVVIGVASVIAVVTLVNGANHYVATKVYGNGADVFTVSKTPAVIYELRKSTEIQQAQEISKWTDYEAVAADVHALYPDGGGAAETTGNIVMGKRSSKEIGDPRMDVDDAGDCNMNIDTGRGIYSGGESSMRRTWRSSGTTLWTT